MRRACRGTESLVKKVLRNQWYGEKEHLMNRCGLGGRTVTSWSKKIWKQEFMEGG